jgi:predicted nucleic acid-binding Zn ribbon protein
MPTYVYEGLNTGTRFEIEQRITEAPLTVNPGTGEPVKRIIFASGIVFKGSGFYKNDSRAPEGGGAKSSKSDTATSDSSTSDSSSSKESKSADSSATKSEPAATTPSTPSSKSASAD